MADREAVEELVAAYRKAVHEQDVDAFVALYDERVRVFDLWGAWAYDGAEAWRRTVTEWFASLGEERVRVDLADVRTVVDGDLAVVYAFVTFTALSADGAELRSMSNRLSWALTTNDRGRWKIVHEHTSAPVAFETGKVVLEPPRGGA